MSPTPIVLHNDNLHLEFNPASGALMKLTALKTGWDVLSRPELGLSFRLLLPLPGRRNNNVWGEQQTVHLVHQRANEITFKWNHVHSEFGGDHPIQISMQVCLEAEAVIYRIEIENKSELVVENVYAPYLGDLKPPRDGASFKTFYYYYATAIELSLYPTFQNMKGYYGIDRPTQIVMGAPTTPFQLLHGEKQGLYVGVHAPSGEPVAWHAELCPGYDNSLPANWNGNANILNGSVPQTEQIGGLPVHTRYGVVHLPYLLPGETRSLTPIRLQPYQGGWQHGVDLYKSWRDTWMSVPKLPAWAAEPHAWQQLHINSPEDELRMKFTELVQIGAECADHGVKAIQLVGWNDGGQDQGNPSHDVDPRLGTADELREAIRQIQALGVKVILFAKFTWADRATEWFRQELVKYATKDPHGDYYHYVGYHYQTVTQLLDINTKRLIPMCFSSEDYLSICDREFDKIVALGADGFLFDECLHHTPATLCFDTSHGHRYGAPVYANDSALIRRFAARLGRDQSDFLFAGEACYDWEFDAYHLSYHRSEQANHIPLSRYMLPHVPLMTAVTGFNDRNMINQCLMYRYIISYEPYNFKGRLGDYPLTVAYGQQMDTLRTDLRAYLWEGEYRDRLGAEVLLGDKPFAHYAVFANHAEEKSAVVIVNYEAETSIDVHVRLTGGGHAPLTRYRSVDVEMWRAVEDELVTVLPLSAVVVLPADEN